jgi:hypothetical protein
MNDTSSDNVKNLEERVTEAGEAFGARVQSATAATAALGCVAGLWFQGGNRPSRTTDDKANAKAPSP